MFSRGFNFAAALAHLRRNAIQLERAIDLFLRRARHQLLVVQTKQPILIQRVAHLQRALAQAHIVVLRAGEVLHRRAIRLWRQQPHIHLHSVAQLEADFVFTFGQNVHDAGEAQNLFDQLGALLVVNATRPGDEHVKIADGLAAAPQRSRGRDLLDPLDVLEVLGELIRCAIGFVQQEAA